MTYFCPECWKEIPSSSKQCPYCRADLTSIDRSPYKDKLIRALRHPEPETRTRAVEILGQIKAREAVVPLRELLNDTSDPYLIGSVIKALSEIEGKTLIEEIEGLLAVETFPLYFYQTARRALRQLKQEAELKSHGRR
jgi:HEAT repeat protein